MLGASPGLVDYHMWPWFERLPTLEEMSGGLDPLQDCPKLRGWVKNMLNTEPVKQTQMPIHLHTEFLQSFATGYPAYDAGLNAAAAAKL